jgi:hypothetical protein
LAGVVAGAWSGVRNNLLSSVRRPADPRAALTLAALAAAAAGLLGTDAGLLWLVAGVWTVRSVAGERIGAAWGIATIGVGLRWGTQSLGDLEVATRVAGASLVAGTPLVRAGLGVAFAAALLEEAGGDGLVGGSWAPRAASLIALAALVPSFCVRGPLGGVAADVSWWAAGAVVLTGAVLLARRLVRMASPPAWVPAVAAAAGVALAVGSS